MQMRKVGDLTESFDDRVLEKYEADIDLCLGDYNKKGEPNTEMAVFKVDWKQFMSEKEIKDYKGGDVLEPLEPAKMFDFSKAKRVKVTREEIKMRELARQAEESLI